MSSIKTNIFRSFNKRVGYLVAAMALFAGGIVPASLVSAGSTVDRSIVLSTTSADAADAEYTVTFTPSADAGAFGVQFCTNSPNVEDTCSAPSGFSTENASIKSGATNLAVDPVNTLVVTKTLTASTPVTVVFEHVHNPTAAGTLYARIITYDTQAHAEANFPSVDSADGYVDHGGVAMSITPTVGVTGAVLETLTFCVASQVITASCGNASSNLPTLSLGEGSPKALTAGTVSTGKLYAQLSSNASKGVIVNLKINNDCGGLKRSGTSACDIAPATTAGISTSEAKFGVKLATNGTQDTALTASGNTLTAVGDYATDYYMNWESGNATGVGSVYGAPIFQTTGAPNTGSQPLTNRNIDLTFGAGITNATPAGNYGADMSMIATGTF